ncbi:hypothetical protein SAVCW2_17720 [Streptomyces avermitilis]|nr:hypothetical protein SAVCW2_17720 [Streptomyces avermitilis]
MVEDVRIALDDGLDDGLGLSHHLADHLLGRPGGGRVDQRRLEPGQLLGDGVDELAQFLGGRAGLCAVLGAAAGLLGGEILGAGLGPGVAVGCAPASARLRSAGGTRVSSAASS